MSDDTASALVSPPREDSTTSLTTFTLTMSTVRQAIGSSSSSDYLGAGVSSVLRPGFYRPPHYDAKDGLLSPSRQIDVQANARRCCRLALGHPSACWKVLCSRGGLARQR